MSITSLVNVFNKYLCNFSIDPSQLVVITKMISTKRQQIQEHPDADGQSKRFPPFQEQWQRNVFNLTCIDQLTSVRHVVSKFVQNHGHVVLCLQTVSCYRNLSIEKSLFFNFFSSKNGYKPSYKMIKWFLALPNPNSNIDCIELEQCVNILCVTRYWPHLITFLPINCQSMYNLLSIKSIQH